MAVHHPSDEKTGFWIPAFVRLRLRPADQGDTVLIGGLDNGSRACWQSRKGVGRLDAGDIDIAAVWIEFPDFNVAVSEFRIAGFFQRRHSIFHPHLKISTVTIQQNRRGHIAN